MAMGRGTKGGEGRKGEREALEVQRGTRWGRERNEAWREEEGEREGSWGRGAPQKKETCTTCLECQVWLASSADNHEMEVVSLGRVSDVDA